MHNLRIDLQELLCFMCIAEGRSLDCMSVDRGASWRRLTTTSNDSGVEGKPASGQISRW